MAENNDFMFMFLVNEAERKHSISRHRRTAMLEAHLFRGVYTSDCRQ